MIKDFSTLRKYIYADLYRYATSTTLKSFLRTWFTPGFRFTFWFRLTQFEMRNYKGLLYWACLFILRHYQFKYGIGIHPSTEIGPGLYIGHYGGIFINPMAKIGANVNLSPGVLVGQAYKKDGNGFGVTIIGNRVFLANNAKVIGDIIIGDDSVIGINSVLLQSITEKSVAVGMPATVKSHKGSGAYVGSYINI